MIAADFVRQSPVAMRYLRLLGPLAWDRFPERDLAVGWPLEPVPYAALAAGYPIKLDQGLATVSALRRYLVEQPALVWLCGFQLTRSRRYPWGFDADASLPTARHLTRMLRTTPAPAPSRRRGAGVPNDALQRLLDSIVALIGQELIADITPNVTGV